MKLVFLLEEPSMKYFLDELLPRVLPRGVSFQTIPHSGKSALRKSLPSKLRGWNEPGDIRFVVLHDQDNKDCIALKNELLAICHISTRKILIRIACQELEAWYFGDTRALANAYGKERIANIRLKKQYRIPDKIPNPKEELHKLIPEHQQIAGAKRIVPHMDIENNASASFNVFLKGISSLLA